MSVGVPAKVRCPRPPPTGDRFEDGQGIALDPRSDRQPIGEEHRIEFAALGDPSEFLEMPHIQHSAFLGPGMAPGRLMMADSHEEGIEVELLAR